MNSKSKNLSTEKNDEYTIEITDVIKNTIETAKVKCISPSFEKRGIEREIDLNITGTVLFEVNMNLSCDAGMTCNVPRQCGQCTLKTWIESEMPSYLKVVKHSVITKAVSDKQFKLVVK